MPIDHTTDEFFRGSFSFRTTGSDTTHPTAGEALRGAPAMKPVRVSNDRGEHRWAVPVESQTVAAYFMTREDAEAWIEAQA